VPYWRGGPAHRFVASGARHGLWHAAGRLKVAAGRMGVLLDSYAVLAYLGDEAGAERVREVLAAAARGECRVGMSLINLGEVLYVSERARGVAAAQQALAALEQLPIEFLPASRPAILSAAHIKACFPVAYAAAFAAASALERAATLLTGDPEFRSLAPLIQIEWLG
jgi:predicted nucleic acid-binding protein